MGNAIRDNWEVALISIGIVGLVVAGVMFIPGLMSGAKFNKDNSFKMFAELKGSVYGPGDAVSLFGVCRNVNGEAIGANAYLTVIYPNGSVMLADDPMVDIGGGDYLWTGTMGLVGGTYLTKLRCSYNGMSAYAQGEWQNPLWVRQIATGLDIGNQTLEVVQGYQQNFVDLNSTLVQLNYTIVDEHNKTNTLIGAGFNYTYSLLEQVSNTANGSVDRNDSLLYRMLYYLLIQAGYPVNGTVTPVLVSTSPVYPVYYENWTITVKVLDEFNRTIAYPSVQCYLSSDMTPSTLMRPVGELFVGDVFIGVLPQNVTAEVDCERIGVI